MAFFFREKEIPEGKSVREIKTLLTFSFKSFFAKEQLVVEALNVFKDPDQKSDPKIAVPLRFGLKFFGQKPRLKSENFLASHGKNKPWHFTGKLLSHQLELKNLAYPVISRKGSVCLFLPCAWGKTYQATELVSSLVGEYGGTGLVVFSRNILETQWSETFSLATDANIEIIGGEKIIRDETQPIHLTVCRINSLKRFSPETEIDVLILDEAHLLCTQNYIELLLRIKVRAVIILTATPERDDGMEKILIALGGGKDCQFYMISKSPFTIYPILTGFGVDDCESLVVDPKLPVIEADSTRVRLESAISKIEARNDKIVWLVRKLVKYTDFKICVILDRVQQIECVSSKLSEKGIDVQSLHGKIKSAPNSRVLIAGIKKAGVGFDDKSNIADWDGQRIKVLIMGISTYKILQALGRIQRTSDPILIQLIDSHDWFSKTFEENIKEYRIRNGIIRPSLGWKESLKLIFDDLNKEIEKTVNSEPLTISIKTRKIITL